MVIYTKQEKKNEMHSITCNKNFESISIPLFQYQALFYNIQVQSSLKGSPVLLNTFGTPIDCQSIRLAFTSNH